MDGRERSSCDIETELSRNEQHKTASLVRCGFLFPFSGQNAHILNESVFDGKGDAAGAAISVQTVGEAEHAAAAAAKVVVEDAFERAYRPVDVRAAERGDQSAALGVAVEQFFEVQSADQTVGVAVAAAVRELAGCLAKRAVPERKAAHDRAVQHPSDEVGRDDLLVAKLDLVGGQREQRRIVAAKEEHRTKCLFADRGDADQVSAADACARSSRLFCGERAGQSVIFAVRLHCQRRIFGAAEGDEVAFGAGAFALERLCIRIGERRRRERQQQMTVAKVGDGQPVRLRRRGVDDDGDGHSAVLCAAQRKRSVTFERVGRGRSVYGIDAVAVEMKRRHITILYGAKARI